MPGPFARRHDLLPVFDGRGSGRGNWDKGATDPGDSGGHLGWPRRLTEGGVLKAHRLQEAEAWTLPTRQSADKKSQPVRPRAGRRPIEKIAENTLPGNQTGEGANSGVYGSIADSHWITTDRLQPIQGSPDGDSADPTPLKSSALTYAGPVSQALNPDLAPADVPTVLAPEADRDEHKPILLAPEEGLSESLPETQPMATEVSALELLPPTNPDQDPAIPIEQFLFQSFYPRDEGYHPPVRIPHLGHLLLLALLAFVGLIGSSFLTRSALHFHLWGISTVQQALTDIHYTIGSMVALYLIAFLAALLVFPPLWGKGFFAGLQWNASAALRYHWRLLGASCLCFLLAMVDEVLLPGPANAPIDKLFETRTAAWILFAFGVTFAPFFEEVVISGLSPARILDRLRLVR